MAKYDVDKSESKKIAGHTLYRVRKEDGTKGGFIEKGSNLSQSGSCWLHGDSVAYQDAQVRDDAQVFGQVFGKAVVRDQAEVHGQAYDEAVVRDNAKVFGAICGKSVAKGSDVVYGYCDA